MSIYGPPLNPNPSFEVDTAGWSGQNATIARSTVQAHDGVASLLITPNGVAASGGVIADGLVPVIPGELVRASMWAYSPAGWSDLRPLVDWHDAGGAFLSSALGAGFAVPAGTWTHLEQIFTVPAGVAGAKMRARHGGTPTAGDIWYADQVELRKPVSVSLVYDADISRVEIDADGLISDTFTRSASNGWGTADSGHVWIVFSGASADMSATGTKGRHAISAVNSTRGIIVDNLSLSDVSQSIRCIVPVLATGAPISWGLYARVRDGSNFYRAEVLLNTDQTVTLHIRKTVGGATTTLGTFNHPTEAHTAADNFTLTFDVVGNTLRAKVLGSAADPVPGGWMVEVTDNDLIVGSVGCRSQLTTGNTNTLPVNIDYDDYTVTFLPDPALVERTVDNQTWTTVRRAAELVPAVGAVSAVDYEFGPDVPNTYRVNTAPVTTLPLAGRLTTDGAGTLANLDASGLTFDLVGRMLRLTLTVDDPVHIGGLNFFTGIGGLTNHIKWRFAAGFTLVPMAKPNERFTVLLQFAEINTVGGTITLSAQGVPSTKSGFTDARLQVFDDGTRPITVILHKAEIVPVAVPGAYASVVFDDSDASITSLAFPKMAALGFRGTDYVIPLSLGLGGKSTLADVQARAAAGWEIAGHSYDGNVHDARYTGSTSAVVKADLASLYGWLDTNVSHPGKRYSFAYPGGEWSQTTDGHPIERLVRQAGFVSGRTTMGNVGVSTHVQVANPRPPLPFRLHAMSAISSLSSGNSNPTTLTAAGGMLDKVAANGGWIILVFHKVVVGAPATGTEISQTDFDAIMDALAAKGLTVLPVREVVDELAATTTPTLDGVWLKSTSDPSLNRKVTVTGFSPFRRRGRAGIFDVKGRADPVAVTDVRSSKAFRLDLRTDPPAEVDGIDELLDGGEALFIQAPTTGRLSRVPTGYVTVADSAQEVLPTVDLQTDVISLDCTRVAAPEA